MADAGNGSAAITAITGNQKVIWRPNPGPQTLFITCPYDEILYGGARGGGKSDGVLGDFLAHVAEFPAWATGIIFRETKPEMQQLIERARAIYIPVGAGYNKSEAMFRFPGGATLVFRYLKRWEHTKLYQGHSYSYEAFDEAGNMPSEEVLKPLRASLRSPHKMRKRLVLTANPHGAGHAWLKARYIDAARPFQPIEEWVETSGGLLVKNTRVYIPSKLEDNPFLFDDPDYEVKLHQATEGKPWLYQAWRYGDWEVVAEVQGALWKQTTINKWRMLKCPRLVRIVIAVDPSVVSKSTSDDCGIVAEGLDASGHGYVLKDATLNCSPRIWAMMAVRLYHQLEADYIIGEENNGGELVEEMIRHQDDTVPYAGVHASRGKHVRAEPMSADYERGRWHHVGYHPALEREQTTWVPLSGMRSPNRIDAAVWGHKALRNPNTITIRPA